MNDYEIDHSKDWDVDSVRTSCLSDAPNDGFTIVQSSRAKKQSQKQRGSLAQAPDTRVVNAQKNTQSTRSLGSNILLNTGSGTQNGRNGADSLTQPGSRDARRKSKHAYQPPPPTRDSTRRSRPTNAAALERYRGEAATATFKFSASRKACNARLTLESTNLSTELKSISRQTATEIRESPADSFAVLIWGTEAHGQQAVLQLERLNRQIHGKKWARNCAFDGRRETRREMKAHEDEQSRRIQLFADSEEYPFEYSLAWPPDSEISLRDVKDVHDRPRGHFESLRRDCQCSIRFDMDASIVVIQGMLERDVVKAGRTLEDIARQMIGRLAARTKFTLLRVPLLPMYQSYVSMEQTVEQKMSLYYLPGSQRQDTFTVRTPKLCSFQSPNVDEAISRTQKLARRLDRHNRRIIVAGLERQLTNLHFTNKAVRMRVDFGELAFLTYSPPQLRMEYADFDLFRQTIAKDHTHVLLQGLPTHPDMSAIIHFLSRHSAFKHGNESVAGSESFVVGFDFCRPDNHDILHHEQEFCESSSKEEMEVRRKTWVNIQRDLDRSSPLVLSMLDFQKFDWQLRLDAHDILDLRHMPKEYADFESGVGVSAIGEEAGVWGTPKQRASWGGGRCGLMRVTNKPVIKFTLGKADHILEIAREDVFNIDPLRPSEPLPASKVTASFYHSKWVNDLGEFAYLKPGERPSWEAALSTFFPEEENGVSGEVGPATVQAEEKLKGPRQFLREVEQIKQILWDAVKFARGDLLDVDETASPRIEIMGESVQTNGKEAASTQTC